MPKQLIVLIREDPSKTSRAAEAIRIALGLSTGPNPVSVILLDHARQLVSEDAYDLPDGEILEKHLPVIKNLELPIFIPSGSGEIFSIDTEFTIEESSPSRLTSLLRQADRVLTF
jgi:sulfur relay (sulfurtransferase) DsrF/TusC family protein